MSFLQLVTSCKPSWVRVAEDCHCRVEQCRQDHHFVQSTSWPGAVCWFVKYFHGFLHDDRGSRLF